MTSAATVTSSVEIMQEYPQNKELVQKICVYLVWLYKSTLGMFTKKLTSCGKLTG